MGMQNSQINMNKEWRVVKRKIQEKHQPSVFVELVQHGLNGRSSQETIYGRGCQFDKELGKGKKINRTKEKNKQDLLMLVSCWMMLIIAVIILS